LKPGIPQERDQGPRVHQAHGAIAQPPAAHKAPRDELVLDPPEALGANRQALRLDPALLSVDAGEEGGAQRTHLR